MRATVEDVDHRQRQRGRGLGRRGSGRAVCPSPRPRRALRQARRRGWRWRPGVPLFGVPSSSISARSSALLVESVESAEPLAISSLTFATALRRPCRRSARSPSRSSTASCAPGRRARGHGGAADGARLEPDVHLDGRIAARVEDLARVDAGDRGHRPPWSGRSSDPARSSGSARPGSPTAQAEALGDLDARAEAPGRAAQRELGIGVRADGPR